MTERRPSAVIDPWFGTVDRVAPWRRTGITTSPDLDLLIAHFDGPNRDEQVELVTAAYQVAASAHEGQHRLSGEGYITHPVAVARVIAELGLDEQTIAAALLHDVVEDTEMTLDDIEEGFGAEVAALVDGVTKLDRIAFSSKEHRQAATMRKLFVAMAKDLRVLILKLSDRLHNMRTIAAMPSAKQQATARETLDVYAPLAHRLGMEGIRSQLEDLAFAALHPLRYAEIDQMVAMRAPDRDLYLAQAAEAVRQQLSQARIEGDVTARPKHLWSIYEKMVVKGRPFEEIFDLVGVRVRVETTKDCYAALGSIHQMWKPVTGRFKDFVAMPKFNNYQSLHTTVIGLQGKPVELQIRTWEMDRRAELGVASHWKYKNQGSVENVEWLGRIVAWQHESQDPAEYLADLKTDLEEEEVIVFTPKGKLVTLPPGATPIDFAYTIHTEVGHRCIGAKIDGKLVALDSVLEAGGTVEIITTKASEAAPSRDWLDVVTTGRAKSRIRQWFSREARGDAVDSGAEALSSALRADGLPPLSSAGSELLADTAVAFGFADTEALYAAIAAGNLPVKRVAARIGADLRTGEREQQLPTTARQRRRIDRTRPTIGVHAEGLDDVMVRLARCCMPVPSDEIVGFVTRGRGVSVHRGDSANAVSLAGAREDRVIDVEWDTDMVGRFLAAIEIKALDRPRLLRDVSAALADHGLSIASSSTGVGADRISRMRFECELGDLNHLDTVLAMLRGIEGVYEASRGGPGRHGVPD